MRARNFLPPQPVGGMTKMSVYFPRVSERRHANQVASEAIRFEEKQEQEKVVKPYRNRIFLV
jgi:hypothetical protein